LLLDGRDPRDARATLRLAATKRVSFAACADRYFEAHRAEWRSERHAAAWRASLRIHVDPVIGSLPVGAIDTGLVLKALEPIWRTHTVTATRVRQRVEAVLDFARVRGLREEGVNPARWKGHLDQLLAVPTKITRVRHYAAPPYASIPEFMGRLRAVPGVQARALEFTILTAARAGEVVGARWGEIAGDTWVISAGRMKGGREHRVPLPRIVSDMLTSVAKASHGMLFDADHVPPGGDHIFLGAHGLPLRTNDLLAVAQKLGAGTTHGFRSAFADWTAEETSFPREAYEAALAHVIPSRTERAYRRADLLEVRRALMNAWGMFCSGEPTGTVVPIRAAARHG
jgi:integrase